MSLSLQRGRAEPKDAVPIGRRPISIQHPPRAVLKSSDIGLRPIRRAAVTHLPRRSLP